MEWSTINSFLHKKFRGLMDHENKEHQKNPNHLSKEYAKVGLHSSAAQCISDRGRCFIVVATPVFFYVMHEVLPEATTRFPENFGKRDPYKVLEAIYNVTPEGSPEAFPEFIRKENFACIFEIRGEEIIENKFLRLDFFRLIQDSEDGKGKDFTGGVLHAFKHFCYQDVPLSTHDTRDNIAHPATIVKYIIDGFFFQELLPEKKELVSTVDIAPAKRLKFAFFLEKNNDVYFLNSVHRV